MKFLRFIHSSFKSKHHHSTFHFSLLRHQLRVINRVHLLRVRFCLNELCLYVLQARKSAMLLLFEGRPFSWVIHVIITLTILGVVLMMAIFVPDISNVFGVVGM